MLVKIGTEEKDHSVWFDDNYGYSFLQTTQNEYAVRIYWLNEKSQE